MFQEIKYRLLTIFLTQKKKLAFLACFIFLGLFVGLQPAHAFILDLANVQLDALDFIDNSVLRYLVMIALLASESILLLLTSANLLDWSSSLPVMLNDNGLVNAGWHFTSGLANLAFILIFIVIALSYILKLETFGMKKALPRLIIIALLVNFSLLFVKMLSDIGWIFQNSFASVFFENGQLAAAAVESLKDNALKLMAIVIGIPAAYLPIALIPYGNVAALFTIGLLLLTGGGKAILLGTLSQTIMVIIFNFVVGFVFLIFTGLFLIRLAAIWILAIFAPLAFIAYILPNTQKYFSQWLKALTQWIFLGVVVFFLMGLGIKFFGLIDLGSKEMLFPAELNGFSFFEAFYKYIFLIIYLIVVLFASKKLVPTGTQMIWGLGEKTVKRMPVLGGWAAKKSREWAQERMPRALRDWGSRVAMTPQPGARKWWGFIGRPGYNLRRAIGAEFGPAADSATAVKISQVEKSIKETEGVPDLLRRYRSAPDELTRIAVLNTMIKRQKINDVMDPVKLRDKYGFSSADAARVSLNLKDVGKDYEKARYAGVENTIKTGFMNLPEIKAFERIGKPGLSDADIYKDTISKMKKVEDWKNITKTVLDDKGCMEAILRNATGNQLSQILEVHQKDGADAIRDNLTKIAGKGKEKAWVIKNTKLEKYFQTPGAQNYGLKL